MKRLDIGQSIAILANLGVIVGIVFLAFEITQNNDLLREQVRSGIVSEVGSLNAALYENAGGIGSIVFRTRDGEDLTAEEAYRLRRYQAQNLVLWQSAYSSFLDGMIEQEDLLPRATAVMFHQVIPGMPEMYEEVREYLNPRFAQWMDENIVPQD